MLTANEMVKLEVKRQEIVRQAISAADQLIVNNCGEDAFEANILTARVAQAFFEKVMQVFEQQSARRALGYRER